MNRKQHEELKKLLLASLEETKRMVAETRAMADAMEAGHSTVTYGVIDREPNLRETRAYIDKVKREIEEQREYDRLPWWRKLFRERPPTLA
jgi:hypothetical protein